MTHFEFISVAVSIVLALSVARLLTAVPHLFAPGRRYWVQGLWAVTLLPFHLGFWWVLWAYRDVDPWTFPGFAAAMLTPALMYLTVTVLVSDSPGTVESWRERFYSRHRVFFSLFFATLLSSPLRQYAVLGSPQPSPELATASSALLLLLILPIGAYTDNERIHQILAPLAAATTLIAYSFR